jgi:hypothetical protein
MAGAGRKGRREIVLFPKNNIIKKAAFKGQILKTDMWER